MVEVLMNSKERRQYWLSEKITVNKIAVQEVIIDPHVDKHREHINDDFILMLVAQLDGKEFAPTGTEEGFSYFVTYFREGNYSYRLVWLQEEEKFYIGVLTAFRDRSKK